MSRPQKNPPSYAIASVDHALRLATMLQLEGPLTVAEAATRLGVARSTAHRLLQMLVYRDFAVQHADRSYRVGPILELAAHSHSNTSQLRTAALPHLQRVVDALNESVNLLVRTGANVRFVASIECEQSLRVTSREGMMFPAHRTTGGLLLLAELSDVELAALYPPELSGSNGESTPDLRQLRRELSTARRNGFVVNNGRSERGVVAVGVPVQHEGAVVAGLSISLPSVRYDKHALPQLVATLKSAAAGIAHSLI